MSLISLIVPCRDEAAAVDLFHRRVCAAIASIDGARFEFVWVNDGSRDGTLDRLRALVAEDPRVRVVDLSRNFGKEAAITAGLDAARGDAVIPIDADLQDPPELIPEMVARWRAGAEVVLARRADRRSDGWIKRTTASAFYRLQGRIGDIRIPDNVGDFRLMDRCVVDALKALPERCRFMKGIFAWVGFRTVTIDYVREPRSAGHSKFSGWRLWNFAIEGITGFSTVPLRVWTYVGSLIALAAFLYALYIVTRTLVHGIDVPGYASLLVFVLFLGGVQLIGIGVIGEYVGRIYLESKQRPLYVVRERIERD